MTEEFAAMDGRFAAMEGRIATGLAGAQVETVALDTKMTEQFAAMEGKLAAEMRTWFMRTMALILTSVIGLIGLIVFLASQGGTTP